MFLFRAPRALLCNPSPNHCVAVICCPPKPLFEEYHTLFLIMSNRREEIIPSSRGSSIAQINNIRNHMSATRARNDKFAHAAAVAAAQAAAAMRSETTPPSQVTFAGDHVSAETLSRTASTSSQHRSPPSPAPSQASSEVGLSPTITLLIFMFGTFVFFLPCF